MCWLVVFDLGLFNLFCFDCGLGVRLGCEWEVDFYCAIDYFDLD